ncbi:hypothetical protein B9Z19DRAFT_1038355 [Tuber borchii]|uniref:Uncharacterized protein n=1 Tax=Tuber borchii TaxID=42251 RepID=A0A2T7A7T3_TUBBO|nr:hypothetical protein B9Z19DRAFT_1038355 [Tuber borchii]
MSHPQIISKHSDTFQNSPATDSNKVKESLIYSPREQPPKSFSSNAGFRKDLIVLLWRFFLTSLSLAILVMNLWGFSKWKPLTKWEQRSYNTISILATGMATLGLGSLLGYLGSMLRWPLLARTIHQMRDVDSILGMETPTRSLRLVKRHIRERRISRTTFIIGAYLVTNILGRLSVAIFGLAFNMNDEHRVTYPTLETNWTSALWTRNIDVFSNAPGAPGGIEIVEDFLNSAWNGLRNYGQTRMPGWVLRNDTEFGDINPDLRPDLEVLNTTLGVGIDTVEYWYNLKDFNENNTIPTNRTAHSAANCSLIEVGEGQYWRWNKWNRTGPFNWGDGYNDDVAARAIWISNDRAPYIEYAHWVSSWDSSNGSHTYSQIYILCSGFAWECRAALTETIGSKSDQPIQPRERFFHPTKLYGLLGIRSQAYTYNADTQVNITLDGLSNSPAQAAVDSLDIICSSNITMPLNQIVLNGYPLWVSGVVARLPILAIIEANKALPKIAQGPHPDRIYGDPYTHTTLEVKWLHVGVIAASITIGQLLAIGAVLYYCNGIYTRDDSHLATAELLKTVINTPGFDGSKLMTGKELAVSLDHFLEGGVSYGTRAGQDGGPPEVDLASGLDAKFPPFPPRATVLEEH